MYKIVVGARFVGRAALTRPRKTIVMAALAANCGSAALRTVYRTSLGAWDEGGGVGEGHASSVFCILGSGGPSWPPAGSATVLACVFCVVDARMGETLSKLADILSLSNDENE